MKKYFSHEKSKLPQKMIEDSNELQALDFILLLFQSIKRDDKETMRMLLSQYTLFFTPREFISEILKYWQDEPEALVQILQDDYFEDWEQEAELKEKMFGFLFYMQAEQVSKFYPKIIVQIPNTPPCDEKNIWEYSDDEIAGQITLILAGTLRQVRYGALLNKNNDSNGALQEMIDSFNALHLFFVDAILENNSIEERCERLERITRIAEVCLLVLIIYT
jgi:hypothetical protein